MDAAPMYDAIAKLSPHGEPLLGDAQVILGDGTTKIMFKHGRARVSAAEAEMLQHRGDIDIPGYVAGTPSPEPVEKRGVSINQDGTINIRDLPPEMRQQLREELGIEPVEREAVKPPVADPEALAAAAEYLAQEGETVPEPDASADPPQVEKTITIPEGFQARTAEGEPRCIARKSDGSQCANAAKGDTLACGLKKHQDQMLAD